MTKRKHPPAAPATVLSPSSMDMYVRMYDDLSRAPDDNPTVGIILCARKDESVVHYSLLNGNQQLFATKYMLILPSEEEFRAELAREQRVFEEQTPYLTGSAGDLRP